MLQAFRKLRNVLGARQRRNTVLIFAMMVILGLLEAGSVASIMPFLAVLMHPGIVQSNTYLAALYSRLAFSDTNAFLVFLAAVVFCGRRRPDCFYRPHTIRLSAVLRWA